MVALGAVFLARWPAMHKTPKAFLLPLLFCLSAWLPFRSPAAGNSGSAPSLEDDARAGLTAGSPELRALERSLSEDFRRHDYHGAEADCTRIIEILPRNAAAYTYRGLARSRGGDPTGAFADFDHAISLDPNHVPQAYLNRGNLKANKGDLAGASADYRQALKNQPDYGPAHGALGNLRQKQQDEAGAESEYTTALKLNPKDGISAHNRALARLKLGRYPEALADANQAIALRPDDADAYAVRGGIEHRQGELSAALKDFRHAVQLDPKRKKTFYNIAYIETEESHYAEALTDLQHGLPALTPDDEDYPQLLAWTLREHLGRGTEADQGLSAYFAGRPHTAKGEWAGRVSALLLGRESEETLSAQAADGDAKKAAGQRCEACYYGGLRKLFSGDKAGAAERFRRCLATEQKTFYEYRLAQAELRSL